MANSKRNTQAESSGDWLSTYADMVTLLLCFFVLLFSISAVDVEKYEMIVKAFKRKTPETSQVVVTPDKDGDEMGQNQGEGTLLPDEELNPDTINQLPENMDELYQYLQTYVSQNNLVGSVDIEKQKNLVFIRFNDNIFFKPDSAELLYSAKPLVDIIGSALLSVGDKISTIRINGHTAQVNGASLISDRILSSNRANAVAYIFDVIGIPQKKTIAIGYGKNYPIADNSTSEGKAKNRRVEIMILGSGFDPSDPESLNEIIDSGLDPTFYIDSETPTNFAE